MDGHAHFLDFEDVTDEHACLLGRHSELMAQTRAYGPFLRTGLRLSDNRHRRASVWVRISAL